VKIFQDWIMIQVTAKVIMFPVLVHTFSYLGLRCFLDATASQCFQKQQMHHASGRKLY